MIWVWGCSCGHWRRQRLDDLGLLTYPRCPWCGVRMRVTMRSTHGAREPRGPSLEEFRRSYRPVAQPVLERLAAA
jgi:hypothetical protein